MATLILDSDNAPRLSLIRGLREREAAKSLTKSSSRPLAAQLVFRGHFISKFSVLAEFIVYLPAATELGVMFKENPVY